MKKELIIKKIKEEQIQGDGGEFWEMDGEMKDGHDRIFSVPMKTNRTGMGEHQTTGIKMISLKVIYEIIDTDQNSIDRYKGGFIL